MVVVLLVRDHLNTIMGRSSRKNVNAFDHQRPGVGRAILVFQNLELEVGT
jgi:hypothetical protein